jgi:phosphohistidine phosphatase SixA
VGGSACAWPRRDCTRWCHESTRWQQARSFARSSLGLDLVEIAEMTPAASSDDLLRWLETRDSDSTVAVVGHEPSISMHVSWLTTRSDEPFLEFKKGGACLLTFYDDVYSGGASLRWMLTPAQLRALGG